MPPHRQLSIDEIGTRLHDTTFVVVDLETTGAAADRDAITEIGAVRVRSGEVLGEFQVLVDPQTAIDPKVQVLTGITERMVRGAPPIESVLPAFLEFARLSDDAVFVAHNARFDLGFLRSAAAACGHAWPKHRTLDTVPLARRVLRGEVPNCKLETLAMYLGAATRPVHRALDDARATVDVMHALLERVGSLGVTTIDELIDLTRESTPAQRRKRSLADDLPTGPGVYIFRDARGEALYVGKSTAIRRRVRTYFTMSEPRARMREMVALTTRVDAVECAHDLEAQVRELRLIDALQPRFNRRSKRGRSSVWLKLTDERFPRWSTVTRWSSTGSAHIGPFSTRRAAAAALDAIHDAVPMRRCTDRITARTAPAPCILRDLGRCVAPCTGELSRDEYADVLQPLHTAMQGVDDTLVTALKARIDALSQDQRYEEAAAAVDRFRELANGLARSERISSLAAIGYLVLAAPADRGRWDVAVLVRGRLASAAVADNAAEVLPLVAHLHSTLPHVPEDAAEAIGHQHEETRLLWRWMMTSGARIVSLDGELSCSAYGAQRWEAWLRDPGAVPGYDARAHLHPAPRRAS